MAFSIPTYIREKFLRLEENERVDLPDLVQQIEGYLDGLRNVMKLIAEPATEGRVFYGFHVSYAGGNQMTLDTDPGLAVDGNGNLVVKPSGETQQIDISLTPSRSTQVSLYYVESDSDPDNRRFWDSNVSDEVARSINTRTTRTYGIYVSNLANALRRNFPATAVVGGLTVPLIPLAVISTDASGVPIAASYIDYRRMWSIDRNTGVVSGGSDADSAVSFAGADGETQGVFSMFRALTAAIATITGKAISSWRDFSSLGTLSEVFTARNGAANLLTGINNAISAAVANEASARASADAAYMPKAGGTFSGAPRYSADPGDTDTLTRRSYVDAQVSGEASARATAVTNEASARSTADALAMPKAGGTFTGAVTVLAPTADMHPSTKKYTDDKLSALAVPTLNLATPNAGYWSQNGTGGQAIGYYKDAAGVVHLRGQALLSSLDNDGFTNLFYLPAGFRTNCVRMFAGAMFTGKHVGIMVSQLGSVDIVNATIPDALPQWICIDGISYVPDA